MKTLLLLLIVRLLQVWRTLLELDSSTMKLLFLPGMEALRWNIGKLKALAVFYHAQRQTPAYQQFLRAQAASPVHFHGLVPNLSTVPVMDKDNYVRQYPLPARCRGGKLPTHGIIIDESSGSSGVPTNWVRSRAERHANNRMLNFGLTHLLGRTDNFIINAFAMGPWATGVNLTMAFADSSVLKSLGPDVRKIENTLQLFGPHEHYVILGYPPFLKLLVDSAAIHWSDYHVTMFYGGEGMSEPMRDYLLAKGVRRVYGSFGASDLELNIASENDFTINLRKLLLTRPDVAAKLVKYTGALPVIFQFNPTDFFIEETDAGELLISLCRPYYLAPKIRYNIHDRGQVIRFPQLQALLASCGLSPSDVAPVFTELPLLLHYGRADMTVAYFGCKIMPADIQETIMRLPELASHVHSFTLFTCEDAATNKHLRVCLELLEHLTTTSFAEDEASLAQLFFAELQRINQDFQESWRMVPPDNLPQLEFHAFRTGPFQQNDLRIKLKYIQAA